MITTVVGVSVPSTGLLPGPGSLPGSLPGFTPGSGVVVGGSLGEGSGGV